MKVLSYVERNNICSQRKQNETYTFV